MRSIRRRAQTNSAASQAEPEKNHQHSRPGSDQHNDTYQEQGESSNDEEEAADLLNGAGDHGSSWK
jgi:hypothetical protein